MSDSRYIAETAAPTSVLRRGLGIKVEDIVCTAMHTSICERDDQSVGTGLEVRSLKSESERVTFPMFQPRRVFLRWELQAARHLLRYGSRVVSGALRARALTAANVSIKLA